MRIISPADRSDAVRDLLLAEPGATHVTVSPGVAVQPAGDLSRRSQWGGRKLSAG